MPGENRFTPAAIGLCLIATFWAQAYAKAWDYRILFTTLAPAGKRFDVEPLSGKPLYPPGVPGEARPGSLYVDCAFDAEGGPQACRVAYSECDSRVVDSALQWLGAGRVRYRTVAGDAPGTRYLFPINFVRAPAP